MERTPRHSSTLLALLLSSLAACNAFDGELLADREPGGDGDAGSGMDGGPDDGGPGGDGDGDGGGGCTASEEVCNGVDDDCDNAVDEDTLAECEAEILNADTGCFPVSEGARCLLVRCKPGFANCDGNPVNGCEDPFCACNECDDAGTEDDGGL
jgi:hypothetical protein